MVAMALGLPVSFRRLGQQATSTEMNDRGSDADEEVANVRRTGFGLNSLMDKTDVTSLLRGQARDHHNT